MKQKASSLEKINNIDKPLAKLTKRRKKTQVNKSQRWKREYYSRHQWNSDDYMEIIYKDFHSYKLENEEEINFLTHMTYQYWTKGIFKNLLFIWVGIQCGIFKSS
jgi:hypothetical protein